MKKLLGILAAATLLMSIGAMSTATAAPVGRSSAGQFYLNAICPVNAAQDDIERAWDAAGLPERVRYGTPLPRSLLVAFKRFAKASGRAGIALNKYTKWPDSVSLRDVSAMVDGFYKDSTKAYNIYQDGAFKRYQGNWAKDTGASQRIRKALNLPPRPQGCPR